MKKMKKVLILILALTLCLAALAMPAASAESGVKAKFGAFAAEGTDRLFLALPVDTGTSLYSMPRTGGVMTLVDSAAQISDLIADASGNLYYLRYNNGAYQVIVRATDGTRSVAAEFEAGVIVHSLSLYNGRLYCLMNNRLHAIDPAFCAMAPVAEADMSTYVIADGIVYYESASDRASYQTASVLLPGTNVESENGRLYNMQLDGSSDMMLFDQGASVLEAYDEYIYFHNMNDNYVVSSDSQEWLDGYLYRLNVQTNQYIKVLNEYDWNYRPTDYGLLIYRQNQLLLAELSGENPVLIYEPDPYNYMALLDNSVIVYEYNLQKLTRIDLSTAMPETLWTGDFVSDGIGEAGQTGTLPENAGTATATDPNGAAATAEPTVPDLTGDNTQTAQSTQSTQSTQSAGTYSSTPTQASAPTPRPGYTAAGSMMFGAKGEDVRAMQKRLVELGYLDSADGDFGNNTEEAVKAFQAACGLTADGIVGKSTLSRLNSNDAPRADEPRSQGTDPSFIFPNSDTKKLTREDILAIDKSLWPYARNEIYARHGYKFEKKAYADYFANKSWYTVRSFSKKDLNAIEWYNMELISDMENEDKNNEAAAKPAQDNTQSSGSGTTPTNPPAQTGSDLPAAAQAIGADSYIFPTSSTQKLTKDEIRAVDRVLWPYARNEIYARHGYSFSKANYKEYFGSKSWYSAGGFDTKDVSEIEWYNMELISWMEKNG